MVVGQGARLAVMGVMVGAVLAAATTRLLGGFLYGVSATDPVAFLSVAVVLAAVALLACWVPARRAARVAPAEALRS